MRKRWIILAVTLAVGALALPAAASAAPPSVAAWYMYGTSLSALKSNANTHACTFAQNQPDSNTDIMLLDFGAARLLSGGDDGTVDFSNTNFKNADILTALESAADGYHNCRVQGGTIVEYGNSNYHMSNVGMSNTDVWNAGKNQMARAQDLSNYQSSKGYNNEGGSAASDMEPSWDGQLITKQLVNGATAQNWDIYDDYGSADGCPQSGSSNGSCNNGWDVSDVGYVSYNGLALPLPEIYYTANADQWTVVRKWWDNNHSSSYFFDGTTGSTGVGLLAGAGWNTLNTDNPGDVDSNLICFGC
jgi:hypothetical protein